MGFVVVGIALVVILGVGIGMFNRLVGLRERYRNAYAQIDVQLKRRYDLIPNLVETAKGYMQHERETLEAVIQARNEAQVAERRASREPGSPSAMAGLIGAEQVLGGLLTRFLALVERYPDLKASQNMRDLQEALATTENRIAFARQAYNDAVMRYNAIRASIPTNLVANAFRFGPAEFFEIDDAAERSVPRLSFE